MDTRRLLRRKVRMISDEVLEIKEKVRKLIS
jgi:hypothetical protein